MRASKIFMPFATVLLYFMAVVGFSTAGDEIETQDFDYERKQIEEVEINEGEEKDPGEISLDEADTFDEEQEW